jgi:hypothetical protein
VGRQPGRGITQAPQAEPRPGLPFLDVPVDGLRVGTGLDEQRLRACLMRPHVVPVDRHEVRGGLGQDVRIGATRANLGDGLVVVKIATSPPDEAFRDAGEACDRKSTRYSVSRSWGTGVRVRRVGVISEVM